MADFQDVNYSSPLEGDMMDNLNQQEDIDDDELSTLDEPVKDTFVSDAFAVMQCRWE